MKKRIESEKIPLLLWLDDLDPDALQQAKNLANLPFAFHHVAIMPDAHVGYGMPIGGVLATQGAVVPNAVGVDIGCGMCAVKTGITEATTDQLKRIVGSIRRAIPLGFKHHLTPRPHSIMPPLADMEVEKELPVIVREYESGRHQVGTLGGGNHFIELQRGSDNHIWLMVHSGSRNLGYKVAGYYNKLAQKINVDAGLKVPKQWQLAALWVESKEGVLYMAEMNYCVAFAGANRQEMMRRIQWIVSEVTGCEEFHPPLDVAHNYAAKENHFGQQVLVHRKGATRAFAGELGIIPGSQGSTSYIVRGLGNPDSFSSCSHGAGRVLGRKQAQRSLDLQQEIAKLEKKGILHGLRSKRDLDEAPSAYKDIGSVMNNQKDLVEIVVELSPLAVVKG
ncbi:RtcB family protein [Desulfogranum marinum]|uniref:RtcB family protein n=1 Tax=Desulfogranum marinum TaxID=453220 RepID=UPI0029C7E113|nr:RtcB family protein [Desulfogranum marinum]